jgi:hypothetical protein
VVTTARESQVIHFDDLGLILLSGSDYSVTMTRLVIELRKE